jgi:hypothetical protein
LHWKAIKGALRKRELLLVSYLVVDKDVSVIKLAGLINEHNVRI